MLRWQGDKVLYRIEGATAQGLLRAALFFRTQHQARLSVPSPHHAVSRKRRTALGPRGSQYQRYDAPSRPGEYLKLRTGHGRAATTVSPTSIAAIRAAGLVVQIGYTLPARKYMLRWERRGGRKGLVDTLDDIRPQLAALARADA